MKYLLCSLLLAAAIVTASAHANPAAYVGEGIAYACDLSPSCYVYAWVPA